MPRKAAAKVAAAVTGDAPTAEPSARRSTRIAEKPAVPVVVKKAAAPKKKRASEKAEEGEDKEEPAAKKAKPDSPPVETEAEVEPASTAAKPASKPASKAASKPASKAKPAAKAKPASGAEVVAAPAVEEAASHPAPIPEEKEKEDETMEVEDKENQAEVAAVVAEAEAEVKELEIGDELPAWTFENEKSEEVAIAELSGEKGLVIFIVPKADTPGCNTQACGFRDSYEEFTTFGYSVYSLSADKPAATLKWQAKKTLPYSLLSDPKRKLITALGASAKGGAGTKRSHVIFEKGTGKLVEKKISVKPAESPVQALDFLKKHHPNETS